MTRVAEDAEGEAAAEAAAAQQQARRPQRQQQGVFAQLQEQSFEW
jgi:hypothetical protein